MMFALVLTLLVSAMLLRRCIHIRDMGNDGRRISQVQMDICLGWLTN